MINYQPPNFISYVENLKILFSNTILNVYEITFQVTEDCCMACTYCYQHNKTNNKMTFNTAKIFIDKLLNDEYTIINSKNTDAIIFDFIGGEPLMEIDLIEQICQYTIQQMIKLKLIILLQQMH